MLPRSLTNVKCNPAGSTQANLCQTLNFLTQSDSTRPLDEPNPWQLLHWRVNRIDLVNSWTIREETSAISIRSPACTYVYTVSRVRNIYCKSSDTVDVHSVVYSLICIVVFLARLVLSSRHAERIATVLLGRAWRQGQTWQLRTAPGARPTLRSRQGGRHHWLFKNYRLETADSCRLRRKAQEWPYSKSFSFPI